MDVDEAEWRNTKEILQEERVRVVKWIDGDRRKGIQVCQIQHEAGGYFLWETEASNRDIAMLERVKSHGGAHVKIGNRRLLSNSRVIVGKVLEEKLRRRGRQSL